MILFVLEVQRGGSEIIHKMNLCSRETVKFREMS